MVNTEATQTEMSCFLLPPSERAGSFGCHPEAIIFLRLRTRERKSIMRVFSNFKSNITKLLLDGELRPL